VATSRRKKTKRIKKTVLRKTSWVEEGGVLVKKVEDFDPSNPNYAHERRVYERIEASREKRERVVKGVDEAVKDKEVEAERKRQLKLLEEEQRRRKALQEFQEALAGGKAVQQGEGPRCSACGFYGHNARSRQCPLFAFTEAERKREEAVAHEKGEVSGHMKLKIRAPLKENELSVKIKVGDKRKMREAEREAQKRQRNARGGSSRRAGSQLVNLNNLLETIVKTLRDNSEYLQFVEPVARILPSYTRVISNPMDLQTMLIKCKDTKYRRAAEFITDLELIASNCHDFNTKYARNLHLEPIARTMVKEGRAAVDAQTETIKKYEAEIEGIELAPPLRRQLSNRPIRHRPSRRRGGSGAAAPTEVTSLASMSSADGASLASSSLASSSAAASSAVSTSQQSASSYQGEDEESSYEPSSYSYGGHASDRGALDDGASDVGSSLFDRSEDDKDAASMISSADGACELGGFSAAPSELGSPSAPSERSFSFASSAQVPSGRLSSLGDGSEMGEEEDPFAD